MDGGASPPNLPRGSGGADPGGGVGEAFNVFREVDFFNLFGEWSTGRLEVREGRPVLVFGREVGEGFRRVFCDSSSEGLES